MKKIVDIVSYSLVVIIFSLLFLAAASGLGGGISLNDFLLFLVSVIALGFWSLGLVAQIPISIIKFVQKLKLRQWLKVNGQIVEATVQKIMEYKRTRSAFMWYKIIAQWTQPSSGLSYTFRSDNLNTDPEDYINPGDKIKVVIDPNNPKRYFVDISSALDVEN